MTFRLAILLTCYNRREQTLDCLKASHQQALPSNMQVDHYLVDDGCTDGTSNAVFSDYPDVKILMGSGDLFWNGGMRLAFAEAIKSDYDFYLWLNDDTILYPEAITTLLQTYWQMSQNNDGFMVVVGSTKDENTGKFSYGGLVRRSWWHPLRFAAVHPEQGAKPCLTMNGNCVLIPRRTVKQVGNLEQSYSHTMGDLDYGLRVSYSGGKVWVSPNYVGTCNSNPLRHPDWYKARLNLRKRWTIINSPKGLPFLEWKIFSQRHAGFFWWLYWLLPYARLLLKP
ncbi:glycosyltransferase family 2 protein [Leptolyngbya boryana CZ1]|uniref:Glycosyltransferase family 2 protein n=1 Tax=Leptolyngbya boryana CZ1 TaxID=3060204 RepID=A0AA97AXR5_LEPBY|nr:glycosyltransferase family 2 protein [Leptolyngbya boryana]WNZ47636.1 glycosyltransferase family 2 protein [Leptolyngbya boryana CZ1]